jgi:hypothetical protein
MGEAPEGDFSLEDLYCMLADWWLNEDLRKVDDDTPVLKADLEHYKEFFPEEHRATMAAAIDCTYPQLLAEVLKEKKKSGSQEEEEEEEELPKYDTDADDIVDVIINGSPSAPAVTASEEGLLMHIDVFEKVIEEAEEMRAKTAAGSMDIFCVSGTSHCNRQ